MMKMSILMGRVGISHPIHPYFGKFSPKKVFFFFFGGGGLPLSKVSNDYLSAIYFAVWCYEVASANPLRKHL